MLGLEKVGLKITGLAVDRDPVKPAFGCHVDHGGAARRPNLRARHRGEDPVYNPGYRAARSIWSVSPSIGA